MKTTFLALVSLIAAASFAHPSFTLRDWKTNSSRDLDLQVFVQTNVSARFADVILTNAANCDRAITLTHTRLLPTGPLVWFDTPRSQRDVTNLRDKQQIVTASPCGTGSFSKWPIVAVSANGRGFALGVDPRHPGFFRLAVDPAAHALSLDFDLGLTPEKPSARVGFVSFEFSAQDGFRGALEAYQRLFPEFNEVRQKNQGSWMAFHPISKIKGWEDFGFAIKEGEGEPAWDKAHGITTYRYTEPSTWWMSIKGTNGSPTMAECLAHARRCDQPLARAWRQCAMHDADGKPLGRIQDTPWCKGIVWNLNCAPGQGSDGEFAAKFPVTCTSQNHYVDSAEMYVTAAMDFNRKNFAGMAAPLVFDAKTLRPCVFKGLMAWDYVRGVWEKARAKDGRTMANGTPIAWCWLVPYLDVLGTETDWHHKGKWEPHSHELMIYMRALCGAKPFCYLQNSDFSTFTCEMSEKFMQRALAYGMYPGYFSPTASSDSHYFTDPKYYERDRPLFKRYMPLCKRIGEAGWRPVNRLLPIDPSSGILAEQFGDRYVTLFNATESTRSVRVPPSRELVTDVSVGGEITLPPETCRVLDFRQAGNGSEKEQVAENG